MNKDGVSIFGPRPHLAFEPGDENVASKLFVAAGNEVTAQTNGEHSLDVLNEAFADIMYATTFAVIPKMRST